MEPESVISLFDSLWYNHEFFKKHPNPSSPPSSDPNPHHKTQENPQEIVTPDSISPVSVLPEPIFPSLAVLEKGEASKTREMSKKQSMMRRSRREVAKKGRARCKSLSELEFEELKGFMNLGFEFSEEDANSSLVEIIPGLHKLMKKTEKCHKVDYCKSRPYLSEAWEAMEKDKRKKALVKWRIPAMSNEVDMKRNLRRWANTVASTFR